MGNLPQQGYPVQGYPPQPCYHAQAGYPTQAGYPAQTGYPAQVGYPPQVGYPQHGGNPTMPCGVSPTACPSCQGKGWRHDSSMDHDKPANEKCFFCKPCPGCGGRGICGAPPSAIPGFGGTCAPALRPSACPSCQGKGWRHDSNMDHDKPPNEKCFFCKPCRGCNGRGVV